MIRFLLHDVSQVIKQEIETEYESHFFNPSDNEEQQVNTVGASGVRRLHGKSPKVKKCQIIYDYEIHQQYSMFPSLCLNILQDAVC